MTEEELYKFLEDCPTDWEEVQAFEGARWIRFLIEIDEENEDD